MFDCTWTAYFVSTTVLLKEAFVLFVSQNVLMELLVLGVLDSVPARTMEPVMWLMAPVIAQRGMMVSAVNNVSSLHAHVALFYDDNISPSNCHCSTNKEEIRKRFDQDNNCRFYRTSKLLISRSRECARGCISPSLIPRPSWKAQTGSVVLNDISCHMRLGLLHKNCV